MQCRRRARPRASRGEGGRTGGSNATRRRPRASVVDAGERGSAGQTDADGSVSASSREVAFLAARRYFFPPELRYDTVKKRTRCGLEFSPVRTKRGEMSSCLTILNAPRMRKGLKLRLGLSPTPVCTQTRFFHPVASRGCM